MMIWLAAILDYSGWKYGTSSAKYFGQPLVNYITRFLGYFLASKSNSSRVQGEECNELNGR